MTEAGGNDDSAPRRVWCRQRAAVRARGAASQRTHGLIETANVPTGGPWWTQVKGAQAIDVVPKILRTRPGALRTWWPPPGDVITRMPQLTRVRPLFSHRPAMALFSPAGVYSVPSPTRERELRALYPASAAAAATSAGSSSATRVPPPCANSGVPPPRPPSFAHAMWSSVLTSTDRSAERAKTRRAISRVRVARRARTPLSATRRCARSFTSSKSRSSKMRRMTRGPCVAGVASSSSWASALSASSASSRARRASFLCSSISRVTASGASSRPTLKLRATLVAV